MKKRSWSTIILFLPAVVLVLNDILLVALPSVFGDTFYFFLYLALFPALIVGIACTLRSDKIQNKEGDKIIGALVFNVILWIWSVLFLMYVS